LSRRDIIAAIASRGADRIQHVPRLGDDATVPVLVVALPVEGVWILGRGEPRADNRNATIGMSALAMPPASQPRATIERRQ